jgi:hypothetical protein
MNDTRPLRTALLANAAFSVSCALLMIFRPTLVGDLLGIQAPWVLRGVGLGLGLFAADLIHQATRPRMASWRALYASGADFLWVLGTSIGIALFPGALSAAGMWIALGVAGVVFIFGAWQLWAVDRAHRAPRAGVYRHCILVQVDAPAERMWEVVSRLGDIKNYMSSLKSSEILEGKKPGVGAVRRCVDRAGKSWSEECVSYEAGRSFVVRFRSEAPDFPFPAKDMTGGWEVAPAAEECEVKVWWELTPKPAFLAPFLIPLLAFQVDRDFPEVIRRMAAEARRRNAEAGGNRTPGRRARLLPIPC